MWAEEAYSLRPGRHDDTVAFGTIRTLRSALSQYETIKAIHSGIPVRLYQQSRILFQDCRVTDQAPHSFFTTGFSARVGTETTPAVALLMRHVSALDQHCLRNYRRSTDPAGRQHWALAGLANTLIWLGWLRSQETFGLQWSLVTLVRPIDGPTVDLPANIGVCIFDFGPTTKTSCSRNATVVIAYESQSGLSCGRWIRPAFLACNGTDMAHDYRPIFMSHSGRMWTSRFYRAVVLYPFLEHLRCHDDPLLRAFDDSPGNSLTSKFWSLHCYHRGARSHATKGIKSTLSRRATKDQVYEHGRWRRRRATEPIDKQYDSWMLQDRIQITLFCH